MEQLVRPTSPQTRHRSLVAAGVAVAITLAIASYPASAEPAGRSQGQLLRRGYDSQVTSRAPRVLRLPSDWLSHRTRQALAGDPVPPRRGASAATPWMTWIWSSFTAL